MVVGLGFVFQPLPLFVRVVYYFEIVPHMHRVVRYAVTCMQQCELYAIR